MVSTICAGMSEEVASRVVINPAGIAAVQIEESSV